MSKGHKRSNREAKEPKQEKPKAPVEASSGVSRLLDEPSNDLDVETLQAQTVARLISSN